MARILERARKQVKWPFCTLLFLVSCGPSPRPVTPTAGTAWLTVLGNARRAPFENEPIPDSLEVAWDNDAGSGLRATVIVTDSAVFVGTTNRQLLALSAQTGRRHWVQRLEGEIASELVRSGSTLFMTTAEWNGRVHARDIARGKGIWRRDTGPARFSPLIEGGIVYVASDDGHVFALRSEDGEQIWRINLRGGTMATPLSAGEGLIVGTSADTLYRIAKQNGAITARGALTSSMSAAPAMNGDTIIVTTHAGDVFGVSGQTLHTLWRVSTGAPILAAPIVAQDGAIHVLNRDAELWRIRGGTGTKVRAFDGGVTSSFTLARDRYVIGFVNGTLLVTDMDGVVKAEHKFNDSVAAPVAIRAGALYVPLLHGRVVKLRAR